MAGMIFLYAAACVSLRAQEFRLHSTGARYGISLGDTSPQFQQAEAFATWNMPYQWRFHEHWTLQSRLNASAGWLHQQSLDGFVGSLGPGLSVEREGLPLELVAGVSPTLLSRIAYADRNFALPFQFTLHLGLEWEPVRHFLVGYRLQHMSNAYLGPHNPGLNLHMFSVGWKF